MMRKIHGEVIVCNIVFVFYLHAQMATKSEVVESVLYEFYETHLSNLVMTNEV